MGNCSALGHDLESNILPSGSSTQSLSKLKWKMRHYSQYCNLVLNPHPTPQDEIGDVSVTH